MVRPIVWPAPDTSWHRDLWLWRKETRHTSSASSVLCYWVSGLYKPKAWHHLWSVTLLCYQDDIISTIQKVTSSSLPKGWHDFDFCYLQIYYLRLRGEILRNNIHYAYKESQNCSHQEYFLSKRNVCSHLLSVMSCFDQSTLLINISPPGGGNKCVMFLLKCL